MAIMKRSLLISAAYMISTPALAITGHQENSLQVAQVDQQSPNGPSSPNEGESSGQDAHKSQNQLAEITVTATRKEEPINRVPISIVAFNQPQMDALGVRTVADIAALTPGLTFSQDSWFSGSNTSIIIRGVTGVGASPTAVYIDDAPVQVRDLGNSATTILPEIFDLQRVEVLRGPQGTLFGSSAEGGAVRFITPAPNLQTVSAYARTELSFTQNGDPSYEAGAAFGAPLVSDTVGFRASIWERVDGGWVSRAPYPPGTVSDTNDNSQTSTVARVALTVKPTDNINITPSVFYQSVYNRDTSAYWVNMSDPGQGRFLQGYVMPQPVYDRFTLPSLSMTYEGAVKIVSTTTYLSRSQHQTRDYTQFDSGLLGIPYPTISGQNAPTYQTNGQGNLSEEARVQSVGDTSLQWVGGIFYSRQRQTASQQDIDNYIGSLVSQVTGGKYDLETYFGAPLYQGTYFFVSNYRVVTTERAAFGQVDWSPIRRLKITGGVRLSRIGVGINQFYDGPLNGGLSVGAGDQRETIVTPKYGVSYQINSNNMVYASAGKGFRPGGAQSPLPLAVCGSGLKQLGLSQAPLSYDSDRLWSYEVGDKSSVLDDRLQVSGSAYVIKRSNLQTDLYIPTCGYGFIENIGSSTNKGGDLEVRARVVSGVTLETDLGYVDSTYDNNLGGGGAALIAAKGDKAFFGPPFTASVIGEFTRQISGDTDGYGVVKYEHSSATPREDPNTFGYDPALVPDPSTNLVSLRFGVRREQWDVSAFVNNVFNAAPQLSTYHLFYGSPLITAITFRPRTFGLTVVGRF